MRRLPGGYRVEGAKDVRLGHFVSRPDLGPAVRDGAWVEWHWDEARLRVQTSPQGRIPLYYYCEADLIAVSTSISDLLTRVTSPEVDWPALAVMLRLGHFVGDATAFRQIRLVPANATLVWAHGSLQIETSPWRVRRENLTREQAIDRYLDLVRAAVRRRPPQTPFAMPLSGGRDSRHLLLELIELGHRPDKVFTSQHYLPTSWADCEGAQAVAARLGIEHEIVTLPRSKYHYERVKNVLTDFSVFEHAWGVELAQKLARFRTIYDGLSGGVLVRSTRRRRAQYDSYMNGQVEAVSHDMLSDREPGLRAVLTPYCYSRMPLDLAVEALADELRRFAQFSNPIRAFYYFNRVRRSGAVYSFGLLNVENTLCPLDDMDLADFGLAMPSDLSLDGTLQQEAIHRRFPAFRDIPFPSAAASRRRDTTGFSREARYLVDIARACVSSGRSGICDRAFMLSRSAVALMRRDPARASWWAEVGAFVLQLEGHLGSRVRLEGS